MKIPPCKRFLDLPNVHFSSINHQTESNRMMDFQPAPRAFPIVFPIAKLTKKPSEAKSFLEFAFSLNEQTERKKNPNSVCAQTQKWYRCCTFSMKKFSSTNELFILRFWDRSKYVNDSSSNENAYSQSLTSLRLLPLLMFKKNGFLNYFSNAGLSSHICRSLFLRKMESRKHRGGVSIDWYESNIDGEFIASYEV